MNLGRATETEATAALARMQVEEDLGRAGRILAFADQAGPARALRYLLDDPVAREVLGPPPTDYGAMTLAQYHDEVFWPARKDPTSTIGASTETCAREALMWRQPVAKRGILDGDLARVRIRELTDQHWERWLAAQSHLAGRSKALRRTAYAALLTHARRAGHTTYRPEFFRIRGATKRTKPQSDALSLEEVRALIDKADISRKALWAVGVGQGSGRSSWSGSSGRT